MTPWNDDYQPRTAMPPSDAHADAQAECPDAGKPLQALSEDLDWVLAGFTALAAAYRDGELSAGVSEEGQSGSMRLGSSLVSDDIPVPESTPDLMPARGSLRKVPVPVAQSEKIEESLEQDRVEMNDTSREPVQQPQKQPQKQPQPKQAQPKQQPVTGGTEGDAPLPTSSLVGRSKSEPSAAKSGAVAFALTPISAIKDVFLRHRDSLASAPKRYTRHQMEILKSICNMVIKICTLYRIDPLSKILKRHQQFIGDASKFLKSSQQEFAGQPEVCSLTEERYYNLVYTYQTVALIPIVAPRTK